MSAKKRNLDLHLSEIFKKFIAIKDEDFKKSQEVFKIVFEQVTAKMKEKCNYYKKYGSQVNNAGSVYDGIKVSKLDEFDMDIVIRLPINYDSIIIENDQAGFVRLKIEDSFDHLDKQQDWEKCHVVTREWRDTEKYFLQNKFRHWLHGIVQKALNDLNGQVIVNDMTYIVKLGRQSGPAYTLFIESNSADDSFKLDVDLVPVIRFMLPRWPEGLRCMEETQAKEWLVVPKPNLSMEPGSAQNRCWRLSFQEFERDMMKGCQQLKTTIRLLKKLRDGLQMKEVASYYIKTLFLWKIDETKDKKYWQKGLGVLFRVMVQALYDAIKVKNIKYFWHEENNLIEKMKPTIQKIYVDKLKAILDAIDANDIDKVAPALLTFDEYQEYKKSDFYEKQMELYQKQLSSSISRQESVISITSNSNSESSRDVPDSQNGNLSTTELIRNLNEKVNALTEEQKRLKKIEADAKGSLNKMNTVVELLKEINLKVDSQNERLKNLEDSFKDRVDLLMDRLDVQNERLKKLEICENAVETDHRGVRLPECSCSTEKPVEPSVIGILATLSKGEDLIH